MLDTSIHYKVYFSTQLGRGAVSVFCKASDSIDRVEMAIQKRVADHVLEMSGNKPDVVTIIHTQVIGTLSKGGENYGRESVRRYSETTH